MDKFTLKAGPVTAAMNQLTANETQHGGQHYKGFKIQTWDFIIDHEMGYLEGNVVKYVDRYKRKNGIEDLRKARHYLDKLIEQVELEKLTKALPDQAKARA